MRFKVPALILILLVSSQGCAVARMQISFYPKNFTRGELGIVRILNCDPSREYRFIIWTPGKTVTRVHEAMKDVSFLCAVPLTAGSELRYMLTMDGTMIYSNSMRLRPKNVKTVKLQMDEKFVAPDRSLWSRLERESKILKTAKNHFTNIRFFGNNPTFPLPVTNLGSRFGEKRIVNGKTESVHFGVDVPAEEGSQISAAFSGTVVLARELYYAGRTVMIEHGYGLVSQYSHMSSIWVKEGDFVLNGATIGRVGNTGQSTGPHLHHSFYLQGMAVDPLSVYKNMRKFY